MYYLEEKQLKPAIILFSVPFMPVIIALAISSMVFLTIELFIVLLFTLVVYVSGIMIFWKLSRRKKYYLLLKENELEMVFHDFSTGEEKLSLYYSEIKEIIYYRITSVRGWLMLFSYVLPKCVYISYVSQGKEQTKFIGYMNYEDIKEIAKNKNLNLRIY